MPEIEAMGGYEQGSLWISESIDKGVSFTLERDKLADLMKFLGLSGDDPWKYIAERDVKEAREWSLSDEKRKLEMKWVKYLLPMMGLASVGAMGYRLLYKVNPILNLTVGFFGGREDYRIIKLKTLKNDGAGKNINPLLTTAFSGWVGAGVMDPLGWVAAKARNTSVDEVFQIGQIGRGEMRLVGLRAWGNDPAHGSDELAGLKILYDHRDDPKFPQLRDIAPFLEIYPDIIRQFNPLPALASPLTVWKSKDTGIYRVVGDLLVACQENEETDTTILRGTISKRVLRKGIVGAR